MTCNTDIWISSAKLPLINARVNSYAGVINDERSVRKLWHAIVELDKWVVLVPGDQWWRVTCDHGTAQHHPAGHAHRLSIVLAVKQHLRRNYNDRTQSTIQIRDTSCLTLEMKRNESALILSALKSIKSRLSLRHHANKSGRWAARKLSLCSDTMFKHSSFQFLLESIEVC